MHDLRGDVRRLVHAAIGVAVHVDEARREDFPGRVDHTLVWPSGQAAADFSNRIAGDADVGTARGRSRSVDQLGVLDQNARRRRRLTCRLGKNCQ